MKRPSLNHRYRLIWSRIQHAWVAVAEHIKSDGKSATASRDNNQMTSSFSSKVLLRLTKKTQLTLVVLSALLGVSQNVYAQWTDLAIESGQAVTEQIGNNLTINVATSGVVGTASSLDIAANENVNVFFELGGGTGLFRSTGNSATSIYGGLNSNGNLFLINQNGVLFGQSAQVDVGGLVASSMNISNADFQQGNYQFNVNGSTNGVTNQGVIKVSDGGYLVLLGKEVSNSGTLVANKGSIVMASADSAVLDFYGNGLVKANLSGDALKAVVEQSGVIQADGGAVQLATNSRSSAVNVSGLVQANSLVERNGVIRLEGGDHAKVSVSGTLNAKGEQVGTTGGSIEVTGEQVALFDGAKVDASGDAGGGTVLVGGDYQGKKNAVYNARTTYIDQNTSINVDANQTGDAGKAIVWADDTTRYYGSISAKGGAQSGDGGFVEVSGKKNLGFNGVVDVSASNGLGGKVLLDPENIILNTSTQTPPPNNVDGTPDVAFADAPVVGTTTVQISDVTGFSELFLQATNDITVANNITMVTNNSIRLEANNDLIINGEVRTQGTGNIDLTADADNSGAGDLTLNRRVFSRQGNINLSGANVTSVAAGQILTQGAVGQDSGNVTINASNAINLAGTIVTNGRNGTAGVAGGNAGNVNINTSGAITTTSVSAYGGRGGTGNTNAGDAGNIAITSTGAGNINVGNLNARNGRASGTGLGGNTGSITINNALGNIDTKNLAMHGDTNGTGGNIDIDAAAGDITVTGYAYTYGGGTAAGSLASGRDGGNIDLDASGNVTVTGRVYVQGAAANAANTAVGGNGGNVNATGSSLTFGDVIYAYGNSGRGLNQAGGNAGNINLNATGAITASNNIYAYGGAGGTGDAAGGNAGNIAITSTGAGDVNTGNVNARNGQAKGTGAGGTTNSIVINNASGNVNAASLNVSGNASGAGGNIDIDAAAGDITVTGVAYAYGGTTAAGSTASGGAGGTIDLDASGDVTVTGRIYAQGGGVGGGNTAAGGNGGNINVAGTNLTFNNVVYSYGANARGLHQAGGNAGNINLNATGAITASSNVYAYGGAGGTGAGSNAAGGDAGNITIASTGVGDITTGNVNARSGAARGTGAGGATNSITINNTSGNVNATSLNVSGNANGDGGSIDVDASGDVTVTNAVSAQGGGVNVGHSAAGGNGGNINIAGNNLAFNNVVYAYGNNGRGLHQAGGDAGNINLNATGAITTKNVYAYGGRGGAGAGSNAAGGDAGNITIASTGAGDINTNHINARNGQARGTGAGGAVGSINISNTSGNIATRNLDTYGNSNGHGGTIDVAAASGNVTVTGRVYSYGGGVNTGHTLAGRNGGDINISGNNRTITSRINASGSAAKGTNQAGGDAGIVSITGAGALSVADVYSRNGNATGSGAGGSVGDIDLSGSSVVASKNIYANGLRNGDGGTIDLTSTTGDVSVIGVYAQGGTANTNTTGNDGGQIKINATGAVTTSHVYVQGSNGNGAGNNGGDAGAIAVNAAGAITTQRVYAYGGTGGGNNALTNTAAGGNAGTVNIASTGAGDIALNQDVNVRTGYSRGSAPGATAGSIDINNADGNISTKNIRAEGQNHGDGSNVTIDAGTSGDVTVTGVIYTFGDVNPTDTTFAGTDAGDITIKGANTIVTNTINANGGRGRGSNQIGGDAGDVTIAATGAISTQAIAASGGNAGSGAGSNAAGGDAGDISLTSAGAGDITTTNITARTGYTRGSATATGVGSVNIQNNDGALTTGNITTRGQRRGYGGDVTAVATGGDISVGTVDARASNIPAVNGGNVTLATTTGDASVTNILTGGRWLVYSGDPRNDTIGAFKTSADFKQYSTNYGEALLDTGNGFVYRHTPIITTSLTGGVSKPYDGNATASIAGLTLNQTGGEIDGDVINISALTSATYDNKNVGTGKTVTSNALSVTSGSNGGTTVYGYEVDAGTGNVGVITESALSIAEAAAEAAAASNPRNDAGLGGLISATQEPQQFLAVFDVNATAAGGDIDPEAEACESNQDKKLNNPNTSLMLNFGVNLPEGVKKTCVF